MLAVQVQYWTLQENIRNNKAQNVLGFLTLNENVRHNQVVESENQRHNMSQESYWNNSLDETIRHNRSTEALQSESLEIDRINAFARQMDAATNRMNAETNRANLNLSSQKIANDFTLGWYNAQTSRLGTGYNYSLGLTSNSIAQQNADINQQRSNIEFLNFGTRNKDTAVNIKNASTNALNAQTNVTRAFTDKTRVDLGYETLELDKQRLQWQKTTDVMNYFQRGAKNVFDSFTNVLKMLDK